MRLYQSVGPNPRVVTLYLAEKSLAVERVYVDIIAGENRQPDFLAKNPSGGSPCLELDDGSFLAESLAICEYLEELNPAPPLLGTTPEQRAETRSALRAIDQAVVVPMTNGFRSAEGLPMFESRMLCVPEAAAGNKAYAQDGLRAIDARLAGHSWICGERFTLADILLFAWADFGAQVAQPFPAELANLTAWFARAGARPSAAISADPMNGV